MILTGIRRYIQPPFGQMDSLEQGGGSGSTSEQGLSFGDIDCPGVPVNMEPIVPVMNVEPIAEVPDVTRTSSARHDQPVFALASTPRPDVASGPSVVRRPLKRRRRANMNSSQRTSNVDSSQRALRKSIQRLVDTAIEANRRKLANQQRQLDLFEEFVALKREEARLGLPPTRTSMDIDMMFLLAMYM